MASTIRVKNPKTSDVKVIPVELEDQFLGRGWEKDTGTAPRKRSAKKAAAAKRTAKKSTPPPAEPSK